MNAKLLLSVVVMLICISDSGVQGRRFAQLTARDWREGRRLYEEERAKSICVNNPLSLRHPEHRIRLSTLDLSQQRTTETVNKTVLLWHAAIVPYTVSRQFSAKQRARIAEAIDHFVADTCVNWKPRMTESDYVEFTPRGQGCMADVGRQGGAQTIVLGDQRCFLEVGDILQLMLHTLGLYHEHQRVDRDQWLSVNFNNIQPRLHSQFRKIRTNLDVIADTPYDFASVTNYGVPNGEVHAMFEPKVDGYQSLMGQRRELSRGDIDKINRLYPCSNHTNVQLAATTESATTTTLSDKIKDGNTGNQRCILLIGGWRLDSDAAPVEYYHPTEGVECNVDAIGNMSTERIRDETDFTSGCYLSSTQQIAIREGINPNKPPMLYGLKDGSAKQLPLPHNNKYTYASTAASVGPSKCLSCGGYDGAAIAECYQFDPSLDASKWTPIAPMPSQSTYPASVSLTENDFFVMGGRGYNLEYLDQLHRYNVDNGTWTEETSMPTKRAEHAAAPLSNTEFIVCGGFNGTRLSICEIYDTTQKKWRTTGSLNQARNGLVMITFEGDIYALGGRDSSLTTMNTVEKYDRATGEWEMAKPMKHPRTYFVGVAV